MADRLPDDTKLCKLDLPPRVRHVLRSLLTEKSRFSEWDWQHATVADARAIPPEKFEWIPNCGKVTLRKIRELLA